ncbi:MAG: DUF11 domain-containing protein [Chloroflexi bacterium]|nr:DUF11 domain-containing protein [Chloroflexota bacterium]
MKHLRTFSWQVAFVLVLVTTLLVTLGGVPVWAGNTDTPLQEVEHYGQCSDSHPYQVAVGGVGMAGQTSGTINVNVPASATIVKAWLYWTGRDPFDEGDPTVRFEGNTLNGTPTGGPALWGTNDFAYAYKADVTSMVSPGTSSYTFEDGYAGDPDQFTIPYGASLVVIYQDNSGTGTTVVETWEGMDIAEGSSSPPGSEGTSPAVFEFDPAATPRTIDFTSVVGGIASGQNAKVYYLAGNGTPPSGDIYNLPGVQSTSLPAAEDGNFMTTFDHSATVPADATWFAVQVRSEDTNSPQLHWIAESFQIEGACAEVEVTKTLTSPASGLAHVGDTITYTLSVENTGNTVLTTVPVTDTFDTTFLSFVSANPAPDSTSSGELKWNDITTALGDLNPGDVKNITVVFTAVAGTQSEPGDVTTNTATVSATDQNDHTAPSDSDTADVEISNPSYTLEKVRISPADPDDVIVVGENVTYRITVTNTGDTILETIPITDSYDSDKLAFVSATVSGYTTGTGTISWDDLTGTGSLAPGDTISVDVVLRAIESTGGADTVNTATAEGVTDENGETLDTQSDTATVKITEPCVAITKVYDSGIAAYRQRMADFTSPAGFGVAVLAPATETVPVGNTVTYRITVRNCGDTVLETVPVNDTFPTDYLDYSSATITPTSVDEAAGTITWNDVTGSDSLDPGDYLTFTVTFEATDSSNPDTITNTACVDDATDENGDHPDDTCDDDDTVIVTNPEVTVEKTRITDSPVLVGDTVQFRITVENTGDTAIRTLPLSDTFDSDKLQFVSASPAPDSTGTGTLSWDDLTGSGDLEPGDSIQVTLTFTALESTSPGTTTNNATVSGAEDENGDDVPTASDSDTVQILTPASLGDYVWLDENGNGIQDPGESGLDGITVKLYDADNNLIDTTTTSGGGNYSFTHLMPGDYYVEFVPPTGYEITARDQGTDDAVDSDPDPSTGKTAVTNLSEGENDPTWDAGMYQPASIGNYVWEDVNGNGLQDGTEPGIDDVTVRLHYAGPDGDFSTTDDNQDFTTTTSGGGYYSFDDLPPGTYYVEFVPPSGYAITKPNEGTDDAVDSDPDPTTGKTATTDLTSGETDNTWDAGMYRPVTIGDRTWVDSDADGQQDPGENGLANVEVRLYDEDDNLLDSTTTNSDGIYHFTDLPPGTYTVRVVTPGSYVPTTPTEVTRTTESGDTVTDADFGFISPTGVSLEAFLTSVKEDGVHLTWRVRKEDGVTAYRIQRATDPNGAWTNIAKVAAQGSGSTYEVVDAQVLPGHRYYYRLVVLPGAEVLGPWDVVVPFSWDPGHGGAPYRSFMPFLSH